MAKENATQVLGPREKANVMVLGVMVLGVTNSIGSMINSGKCYLAF